MSDAPDAVSQDLLDELTRRFAATAAEYDQRAVFPTENLEELHKAGLLGLTVERTNAQLQTPAMFREQRQDAGLIALEDIQVCLGEVNCH